MLTGVIALDWLLVALAVLVLVLDVLLFLLWSAIRRHTFTMVI